MPPRVVVRSARRADAGGLATVYTHAFGPRTRREVLGWWDREIVPTDTLVAVVDGVIASTVEIQYHTLVVDGVPIRTGGIAGVATHWDYRGRGLATRLMREAHRRIRARDCSTATLFTGHNLPAIRIYRRLGYSETQDWIAFFDAAKPVDWVRQRFEYRGKWMRRTPYGRALLRTWRGRVWMVSPEWSATITCDGRSFRVTAGRRGRPDVVLRGRGRELLHVFGDVRVYDLYRRTGRLRVTGRPEPVATWRRLLTMEWRE